MLHAFWQPIFWHELLGALLVVRKRSGGGGSPAAKAQKVMDMKGPWRSRIMEAASKLVKGSGHCPAEELRPNERPTSSYVVAEELED